MSKKQIFNSADLPHLEGFASRLTDVQDLPTRTGRQKLVEVDPRKLAQDELFKQTFQMGYDSGFSQGVVDGRAKEKEQIDLFAAELRAVVDRIERAMDLWYQKAEHGLASLSVEIARCVVGEELQIRPDAILSIVRDAMKQVRDTPVARVRINPFDLQTIVDHKKQIEEAAGTVGQVEIVGDDSLSRGSVLIETDGGVVDATVESKTELLYEGEAA